MKLAPVILFVYNRPDILLQTLNALKSNFLIDKTELHIYADGPKANAQKQDIENIAEVRRLIKNIDWAKELHINISETNKGLSNSIIHGVTEVVSQHGKSIILEDDIVTSPYFLKYMNSALELYSNDTKVACISGYTYPLKSHVPASYFIRGADCWGWATWERAWKGFESNAEILLQKIKANKLESLFNLNDSFPYVSMLEDQIKGNVNSWAIRWHATAFLNNQLTLYPAKSLVKNIGLESGTHGGDQEFYATEADLSEVEVKKILIRESEAGKNAFIDYFKSNKASKKSIKYYIKRALPPFIIDILGKDNVHDILFKGNYSRWEDAQKDSIGYNSETIIEKVTTALLKVKNKEVLFERDSVIFHYPDYSWPLLSSLLLIKSNSENRLNIIDFGGSLGSTYYQYKDFIIDKNSSWNIVEQANFIKIGRELFQDTYLKFYETINEARSNTKSNCLLISSTLQYLENPEEFIQEIISHQFEYILFDKTPFINSTTRLTVQNVPREIYSASYPAWIFEYDKVINLFANDYELLWEFDSYQNYKIILEDNTIGSYKGFLLKRNNK